MHSGNKGLSSANEEQSADSVLNATHSKWQQMVTSKRATVSPRSLTQLANALKELVLREKSPIPPSSLISV